MIRDKIFRARISEEIYLKCHGCNLKGHTFEKCDKVHFIPNKDFLIARHLYSVPNLDRCSYERRLKKENSLQIKRNVKAQFKLFFEQKRDIIGTLVLSKVFDNTLYDSESSSSEDDNDDEEKENQIKREGTEEESQSKNDNTDDRKSIYLEKYRYGDESSSFTKKTYEETYKSSNSMATIRESMKTMTTAHKRKNAGELKKSGQSYETISEVVDIWKDFDRVKSYPVYFPEFNVENVIKNYIHKYSRKTNRKKRGLKRKNTVFSTLGFALKLTAERSKIISYPSVRSNRYGKMSFFGDENVIIKK